MREDPRLAQLYAELGERMRRDMIPGFPSCQQADCVDGYLPTEEGDRYRCPDCAALSAGTATFAWSGDQGQKAVDG